MGELVADTAEITDLEQQLDALDRHGYLLVRGALNLEIVEAWRECLTRKYKHEEWDISNEVGNVAFDHLLEQEPGLARPLVGHASVATYLKAMLGRQCQLRSFRAHINPAAYTQNGTRILAITGMRPTRPAMRCARYASIPPFILPTTRPRRGG